MAWPTSSGAPCRRIFPSCRRQSGRPCRPSTSRLFGTFVGIIIAVPLALLAAANVTPSRFAYYAARAIIGFTRAVPDLVWALLFVTAVGLGPFPGGLALGVHSVGYARPVVRRDHRADGHGADPCAGTDRRAAHPGLQSTASSRPSCHRCLASASIVLMRIYAPRWCSASSAPAGSASSCSLR